jgi:hypothetical protein
MLNEGLRYLDQMVGATVGDLEEQKYSTVSGTPRPSPTKYTGLREAVPPSAAKRLFNIAGFREFEKTAGASYSEAEAGDNRYNQLFNKLIERDAAKLLASPKFRDSPLESRKKLVSGLITDTRKSVKEVMKSDVVESGDRRLQLMLEIAGQKSEDSINKALKDLSKELPEKEELKFDDLTEGQLETLRVYFNTRDEFLDLQ